MTSSDLPSCSLAALARGKQRPGSLDFKTALLTHRQPAAQSKTKDSSWEIWGLEQQESGNDWEPQKGPEDAQSASAEQLPNEDKERDLEFDPDEPFDWRAELKNLEMQRKQQDPSTQGPMGWEELAKDETWREKAFLVGASSKTQQAKSGYSVTESLAELERLASSAGLQVVGKIAQTLDIFSRTYVGTGKVKELAAALEATQADTVIFDDELSPGQLRALEKALGSNVGLCDRTALILDIFSQRAASREGQLQVELAQCHYQLPRLTRLWTHLERQAGGRVRGMGEKQLEIDKRLLRSRIAALCGHLDDTRRHRRQSRDKRAEASVPVVALCGYTNAGKSTLLNALTEADVVAHDVLFATLDPTTRRLSLPSGREVLMSDTVGFIQKLPTQLVAAFRATLEEIAEAQMLVHVVDVSHPNAAAQSEAVMQVLEELEADELPLLTVWNKVDACAQPDKIKQIAARRPCTFAVSATTGEGIPELLAALERQLSEELTDVHCLVPYSQGDLLDELHRQGTVQQEDFVPAGTLVAASVPAGLANRLRPLFVEKEQFREKVAEVQTQL